MAQELIGKEDAKMFFIECCEKCFGYNCDNTPRDIIQTEGFPLHYKRAWYLLQRWSDKGWYDYGVNLELGWITKKGLEIYNQITLNKPEKSC